MLAYEIHEIQYRALIIFLQNITIIINIQPYLKDANLITFVGGKVIWYILMNWKCDYSETHVL